MLDYVKAFVKSKVRKDTIAVMIHTHDSQQYIVDRSYFVTRRNQSIAQKGHWEKISRAARRIMRYLDKTIIEHDYEMIKSRNLGPNRTHFVIWFPQETEFKLDSKKWREHVQLVAPGVIFLDVHPRTLKFVSKEAKRLHEQKYGPKVDLSHIL